MPKAGRDRQAKGRGDSCGLLLSSGELSTLKAVFKKAEAAAVVKLQRLLIDTSVVSVPGPKPVLNPDVL